MTAAARTRDRKRRSLPSRRWVEGLLAGAVLAVALFLAATLERPGKAVRGNEVAEGLPWSELRPQGAPAGVDLGGAQVASLDDADPRAARLLRDLRAAADQAPAVPSWDGRQVSLLGYVVPLDGAKAREFLLVPYFGACIHSPPPPANQVVHVMATGDTRLRTMDRVLVRGVLRVDRADHGVAASGYRMAGAQVEPR